MIHNVEQRFCYVNCGLPSEQCACYVAMMEDLMVTEPIPSEGKRGIPCPRCEDLKTKLYWTATGEYECTNCGKFWRKS